MEPIQDRSETDLGDYFAILKRRWIAIAAVVALALGVVAAMDLTTTPTYQASAELLLQPTQSESIFSTQQVADPTRAVQNELKIISSLRIRRAVTKAFGREISVSAASGGADDVIILTATSADPEEAARMVNVYAETYQNARLDAQVDDLTKSKLVIQQQVNDFQAQIDELNRPLADLDEQIDALPADSPQRAQLNAERNALNERTNARRQELTSQLNEYQQRLQIMQLSERLTTTGGVQILNPAGVPSKPISPNIPRDLIQGALIGLFLGIGLALVLEQLDDSIRTVGDIERAAKDLPVLGLIPADEGWRDKNDPRLSTLVAPISATAESYRGIRTSLQYIALRQPLGVVQLTSSSASEGKSSTLANLAIAFAEAGMNVAVVGCDLRRPRIHNFLQVDGSVGLTSVLLGDATMSQALQQSPVHPNIRVLPSGPRPPNPSELLSLDRTAGLIRSLLDNHAVVFVDCPPVLPVTDSLVLSRCVDASLFVAMANKTTRREVKRSIERLKQVNSPLIGTLLNGVNAEGAYGSLYEYYGYLQPTRIPLLRRLFRQKNADVPSLSESYLPEDVPYEGSGGYEEDPNRYSSSTRGNG